MIKTKNDLLKDCYVHSFKPYRKKIQILTNEIKSKKKSLKKSFIKKELEKAGKDIKKLWKILNFISNRTKTKENTEPENINQELANKYNKFFSEIGIKIQKELGLEKISKTDNTEKNDNLSSKNISKPNSPILNFEFKNVDSTLVRKHIKKFENKCCNW